ncbi:hypothetical protein GYMLUDRAFT_782470 [Collybiopsis luxurians FD-317 M1]|uniref:Transmembrane protein n=1 Tax=Collybiopsis luxurians FD-317 M1 TaxID=944289 RepID=A0A0D0B0C7_9AGAR|nr:hypothetical protein GYMLUDRAFT_782470 [Collybiopsis luxurians FD-317 M1]
MSVEYEPVPVQPMDLYSVRLVGLDEKNAHSHLHFHQEGAHDFSSCRHPQKCHSSRLKRVLVPVVMTLVTLGALFAVSCFLDAFVGEGIGGGLLKRATDGSGSGNDSFVNRKFYLIVIFVGLLVVVILGICLSAWCCRGSFENPLCCPCYLCACCGGLACLECIGCGLCAEGLEQA